MLTASSEAELMETFAQWRHALAPHLTASSEAELMETDIGCLPDGSQYLLTASSEAELMETQVQQ